MELSNTIKILVDKNGFGIFSLFGRESTKEVLHSVRSIAGGLLSDLGIKFDVGDEFLIKENARHGTSCYTKVRVYNITNASYHCEVV